MKYSKQRNLILNVVRGNPVHPTAEWIYQHAKEEMPSIGIATVYRNLNSLVQQGEIIKISTPNGVDKYDGHLGEHYHMCCSECGQLIDLQPKDLESLKDLRKTITKTFGLDDENVMISDTLLTCVCNNCLKKGKSNN